MRIRDFFRGPSTSDRKLTLSSSSTSLQAPVIDVKTFLNAALENDTQTLQKYLLAGFPVDQADPATQSRALHLAVESGHLATCQLLLQANAQVNVTNASLSSPLHCAAYAGHEEIVQLLLAHGADVLQQDHTGRTPFHWAVSSGNIRLVEHFLVVKDFETNLVNIPDRHRWTPLMCACASNQALTCALLLAHQADLTSRNDRGMTIFHLIAFLGSSNLLREILSTIDEETAIELLNQVDQSHQTPLFIACIEGHLEIALILIHAGANPYHLDDDHQTCLHAMFNSSIILKRHLFLFYRFIQFVDFRDQKDRLGRTLLDLAILNRYKTLIFLLEHLKYKRNIASIDDEQRPSLLSLRQIVILKYKRSITYSQRAENPEEILRLAFEQTFHLHDDLVLSPSTNSTTKYQKNHKTIKQLDKKLRKTMSIFHLTSNNNNNNNNNGTSVHSSEKSSSQMDLSRSKSQPVGSTQRSIHPMTSLLRKILSNEQKLVDLIDFPSLNGNSLLEKDLQWSIENYQLLSSSTVKSN